MKKILVIEDDVSIRNRILDTLELGDERFEVFAAANGREGITLANQRIPDLIISDVMMPELDGYGVLEELRNTPATALIPFIFLSAKADRDHVREGMLSGADDYLAKPFSIDDLLKTVQAQLSKAELQRQQSDKKLEELRAKITVSLPHEFRTPLSSIIGFGELLKHYQMMSHDDVMSAVDQICNNAIRLQRLVENFLLYTQIEMAASQEGMAMEFRRGICDVNTESLTSDANERAGTFKRTADITVHTKQATIAMARHHVSKIIEELVDNACKFSEIGTTIQIEGKIRGNFYDLMVSDTGRGMSPEQIAGIGAYMQFERNVYEQQGPGLGLILVKRLAEVHGGTFGITSQLQRGTAVRVSLPIGSSQQYFEMPQ